MSFSSYLGHPLSIDDFYVTNAGLAVTETTLNVFNFTIYDGNVVPQTLLHCVRATFRPVQQRQLQQPDS